jgi:hypothetical protein
MEGVPPYLEVSDFFSVNDAIATGYPSRERWIFTLTSPFT